MKAMRWVSVGVGAMLVAGGMAAQAGEAEGEVTDTGYGKFKMKDKDGVERLFNIGNKDTSYTPSDWKPSEGDKVAVTFTEKQGRSGVLTVATQVKMVKLGPNVLTAASPVDGEVVETGTSSLRVKVGSQSVRFTKGRKTLMTPAGWVPAVGDKVKIDFHKEPGKMMMLGVNHVADKIEKQ
jgi:hypothetical protein